jgi:hypothetical protein
MAVMVAALSNDEFLGSKKMLRSCTEESGMNAEKAIVLATLGFVPW